MPSYPEKIMPCPVLEAVGEMQFKPSVPDEAVIGIVYQALKKDFPDFEDLPILQVPPKMRHDDPTLNRRPLHRLNSENFLVMLGPRVAAMATKGDYCGWTTMRKKLTDTMGQIHETGAIESIDRFGLRYINFFLGDVFDKLTLSIAMRDQSVITDSTQLLTTIEKSGCKLKVRVSNGSQIKSGPHEGKIGTIVDIDACSDVPGIADFSGCLDDFLARAHDACKETFFSLLRDDFVATLNPEYSNDG